jgi:hypothetical protein
MCCDQWKAATNQIQGGQMIKTWEERMPTMDWQATQGEVMLEQVPCMLAEIDELRVALKYMTANRDEYQREADGMAAKHKVERDGLAAELQIANALLIARLTNTASGEPTIKESKTVHASPEDYLGYSELPVDKHVY